MAQESNEGTGEGVDAIGGMDHTRRRHTWGGADCSGKGNYFKIKIKIKIN